MNTSQDLNTLNCSVYQSIRKNFDFTQKQSRIIKTDTFKRWEEKKKMSGVKIFKILQNAIHHNPLKYLLPQKQSSFPENIEQPLISVLNLLQNLKFKPQNNLVKSPLEIQEMDVRDSNRYERN